MMVNSTRFAAQILGAGARGYAAMAADQFMELRPDIATAHGDDARSAWRANLTQRLLELQTAVELDRPHLFVERVRWSRRAYQARAVAESELRDALEALRGVLAEDLPPTGRDETLATLDAAIQDFANELDAEARALDPESESGRFALRYLLSTLEGRSREAIEELLESRRSNALSLRRCVVDVLVPAQREIGRLWHAGDSDIAEEHLVTSTTKRALAALAHAGQPAGPRDLTLMTAAVQGDSHDIGGQALIVLMEDSGWRCVDLGADVPAEDLVAARTAFEPTVVVVSATLATQLPMLERSVRALRANAGGDVRIVVAGAASATDPDLPQSWGADATVDSVESALAQLEAWYPDVQDTAPGA